MPILVAVIDYVEQNNLSLDSVLQLHHDNKVDFSVITEQDLETMYIV